MTKNLSLGSSMMAKSRPGKRDRERVASGVEDPGDCDVLAASEESIWRR